MYSENVILKEILEGKEKRAKVQRELINEYKTTLISFTLNIPGINKRSDLFKKVHETGINELEQEFNNKKIDVQYKKSNSSYAGYEAFFCIDVDPAIIKKIVVDIEEKNELGRLFDFDVFDKNFILLSRTELGLPKRKCLLCEGIAAECTRSRKHHIDEVLNKINIIINKYYVK
jgi:holo-ACP synthase